MKLKKAKTWIPVVMVILVLAFFLSRKAPSQESQNPQGALSPDASTADPRAASKSEKLENATTYSAETQEQLKILTEILKSKNDNDPRMDKDLLHLSDETKKAFRDEYHQMPPELRNDRGTIVFLLGRNLTSQADYQFLLEVLTEQPCLGLTSCSEGIESTDLDSNDGMAITLAYPQLNALKAVEKYPTSSLELKDMELEVLKAGSNSPLPVVSSLADQVLQKRQ